MIGRSEGRTFVWQWLVACLTALPAGDLMGQERVGVSVPLVNIDGSFGLTAAPGFGMEVSVEIVEGKTPELTATRLTFSNQDDERRIAALEGVPRGPIEGARALAFECWLDAKYNSLRDTWGPAPSIAALFFENDGGTWYQILKASGTGPFGPSEFRIPLRGTFNRALFASDTDAAIRWEQVERVWLGVVDDGPLKGAFEVRRVRFTDEPFHPTSAVWIDNKWEVSQDPAVRSELSLSEGDGAPVAYFEFEIPGGRHMYAMIRTPVDVSELDAYRGLRFGTVLTELPEGIDGLLVMLIEKDGSQYRAVSAPRASREQKTVTISFSEFERGSWSKDENDRLDLDQVNLVAIGMHGTTPKAAKGTIVVIDPQFIP